MDGKIFSAFCLAAPRSGEGKTTVAAGIMRALTRRGLVTQGFKCGPDYVDPTFHARATGRPGCNLDTWLMGQNGVRALWARRTQGVDVAVCEGVMGLFDGREPGNPAGSTADCAQALNLPVVLVVNARGMAGSLAALVAGFAGFQATGSAQSVRMIGVIADNVGSHRHVDLLRRALAEAGLPPLLGALPRREAWRLPERQLGLIPAEEMAQAPNAAQHTGTARHTEPVQYAELASFSDLQPQVSDPVDVLLDDLAEAVEAGVDLDRLLDLARGTPFASASPAAPVSAVASMQNPVQNPAFFASAASLASVSSGAPALPVAPAQNPLLLVPASPLAVASFLPSSKSRLARRTRRLAVARDAAFLFYYDENERVLRDQGWEMVPFSPLSDVGLPHGIDALYLGGGYPEVFARQLAANAVLRGEIRHFAAQGGEIYAECGGYMYLCRELVDTTGVAHPMCGVIEGVARMGAGLRSLGYRSGRLAGGLPFGLFADRPEAVLRGHEFHWSQICLDRPYPPLYTLVDKSVDKYRGNEAANPDAADKPAGMHAVGPSCEGQSCRDHWCEGQLCADSYSAVGSNGNAPNGGVAFNGVRAGYVHWYWAALNEPTAYSASPEFTEAHAGGAVLLLNGPSSAGKTSLALALQQLLERTGRAPALVFSVDRFLEACPGRYTSVLQGARETGLPFVEAFHAAVACAARKGARVIVDHVVGEDPAWVEDLLRCLHNIPLHCVQVTCAPEVLHRRELERRDRLPDWVHARRQWASIHVPLPGAITLDTTRCPPDEGAARLLAFWDGREGDKA